MWSTHVRVHVHPGGEERYERWKIVEGTIQRSAPGFVKRTLLRSRADPTVYFYQSFWESEGAPGAFSASEAFQELGRQYSPVDVFAEPMDRNDCTVLIDEAAAGVAVAPLVDPGETWQFHVRARVQPGGQERYELWKTMEGTAQTRAPGFIKRTLLRSLADPTVYFYQSFWTSQAQAHAFSSGEAFRELFSQYSPREVFAEPMEREECDVIFDETATGG